MMKAAHFLGFVLPSGWGLLPLFACKSFIRFSEMPLFACKTIFGNEEKPLFVCKAFIWIGK